MFHELSDETEHMEVEDVKIVLENLVKKQPQELDIKVDRFLQSVKEKWSPLGHLVFIGGENNGPVNYLMNGIKRANCFFDIRTSDYKCQFIVNNICVVEDDLPYPQLTNRIRHNLKQKAYHKLAQECFTVVKKDQFEDISLDEILRTMNEVSASNESMSESDKLMVAVTKILKDFASSDKVTILRFCAEFNKEERDMVHVTARACLLKSKSLGSGASRRVSVSKVWDPMELVRALLINGCESLSYRLLIPVKFAYMWRAIQSN